MNITVTPLRRGRFAACLDGRLLCHSRTPFLSAARVLQREGVPDETPITMRHEGEIEVALRSTVGAAAKLTIVENEREGPRFARYRPFSAAMPCAAVRGSSRIGEDGSEAVHATAA
jgi:hypothetical protein